MNQKKTSLKLKQPVAAENKKHWVGSYFGIPEPEKVDTGKPTSYTTVEAEIHILLNDLTVDVHTIKHDRQHQYISPEGVAHLGMFDPQDVSMPLKQKAWQMNDAIGFVIYYAFTNSITGVRKEGKDKCICAKVGRFKWRWVYDPEILKAVGETDEDNTFIPDVVKMRNPEVFSSF